MENKNLNKYENLGKVIYVNIIIMLLISSMNSGLGIMAEVFD